MEKLLFKSTDVRFLASWRIVFVLDLPLRLPKVYIFEIATNGLLVLKSIRFWHCKVTEKTNPVNDKEAIILTEANCLSGTRNGDLVDTLH